LPNNESKPKTADFRTWSELIADTVLPGSHHEERRGLLKSSAHGAWKFTNWLTHAKQAHANDAEAAFASTELTMSLFTTALIRHVRGVPDRCPSCGSHRLSPERGFNTLEPEMMFERPVCQKCSWTGTPVPVVLSPKCDEDPPDGDCAIMDPPLREFPGYLSDRPKE
jgi:hypothetical protein